MAAKDKKINIITLGCSKNVVDSEVLMRQLQLDDWEITDSSDGSQIAVINTCGFIQSAKQESIDAILEQNWAALKDALIHIILPALTLGMYSMAIITRMTRSTMLETLGHDYIRTARAKGLSERAVFYKHALRNALIPLLTITGLNFGFLLAGAVLTETVYAWPGLGRLLIQAINFRDYPLVQGCILFIAVTYVGMNLLVDLAYGWLDPRIRYR